MALWRRHSAVHKAVSASRIDTQLFYRLVSMAVIETCCTLPLVTYLVVTEAKGYYPWKGFADLHLGFTRVDQWPYGIWSLSGSRRRDIPEWFQIGCGILFFLLLGLTRDQRSRYKRMFGFLHILPNMLSKKDSSSPPQEGGLPLCCPWVWRKDATHSITPPSASIPIFSFRRANISIPPDPTPHSEMQMV